MGSMFQVQVWEWIDNLIEEREGKKDCKENHV